ncbi:MAG: peptidoglycan-associated lipoprotein Pal [Terracidiphilus sp.]
MHRLSRIAVPVLLTALVAASGCKKKIPPTPVATAPPVTTAPTATITATPSEVTAGNPVVLSWNTTNASSAAIDGLGDVASVGSKTVTPTSSMSYHLVAKGAGGTADATASVTVNAAPAVAKAPGMSAEDEFRANIKDVFFEYDTYSLRSDAEATLSRDAAYLASHPDVKIVLGGYCDDRGSDEYNLALGQNRAGSAQKMLEQDGVAASRIRVISYGKEKPFCSEATEACWQQNRRAGFSMAN